MKEWSRLEKFLDSYDHYRIIVGRSRMRSFFKALRWELIGTEAGTGMVNDTAQWWTKHVPLWLRHHGPLKRHFWQEEELDLAKRRGEEIAKLFGAADAVEYERRDYP